MVVSSLAIAGDAILPPATAGVPYTHTFTATGSSGTLVWSATGLPPGLTLSPNGTITGSATGVFGNFSPLVTVTDGVSPVTRRFTLVPVQPNPQPINVGSAATALTDATAGQLYTASLTGGRPPVTWTVAPGSALPAGLTLVSGALLPSNQTPGTTLLSGMPTAVGLYTFDLMATDAIGIQGRRTFTLRVSPLGVVIPGALRNPVVGTAYAQQLTVVGGTAPYSFSISPTFPTADLLPPGLSMSTGGLISGTALSTGSYAFRLKVTDSTGNVFTRTQSLTVTNAQNRFMISNFASIPDLSVGLGRTVTLIVSNAPANAAFTWSSVGPLPPGLQLVTGGSLAPNVATLAGRVATPGVYQFTVRATNNDDAADFVDRVFTARYAPIHLISPALNGAMPEGTVGVPYTASLKVAGGVPPYIFSESPFFPLPPGLSIASNGTVSGTPTRDGLLQLIYDVVDSAGNALAGIGGRTISINKPGSPSALAVPSTSAGTSVQLQEAFVGVPFADGLLDQRIRGGVPPYTWTVAAGSALPPGLSVLSGANGVSDRLGGTPTEQGEFDFSLTAFDASGQSLTLNFSIEVIPASLSANLVPGIVGTAYSVPLVATGGLPPYTFGLALGSDLPPGLTLGANGVFSGLPSHPGLFQPVVDISDSAGNTLSRRLRIAVDNSAGQAPALQVTPTPIQVLYIQGGPAPAPVSVSVATTSSLLPFGADVGGVPGASLSAGSGTTPSALDLTFNVTGLANGTYAGSIAVAAPGTVDQWNLVPVMLTVAAPPPCTYTLSKTATSVPAGGTPTPSYVNVTAGPTCAWTAVKSDSWITITSGGAGTGNGKLNYIVAANPSSAQRSGSITVANQTLVITQFGSSGCSFGINPVTVSPTAAGGMLPVSVAASNSTCSWSASSTSGLSLIPSGGAGSAVVNVTVPPNDQPAPRVLTATIAGQVFTVNQTGINCAVTLSPYEWTATATGAGGSIAVTTQNGCGYDTVLGPSWISVTSGASGVGSSTLFFDIAANSTTLPRTGTLSIGGQNFTVTQEALPCSVTMNTASLGSPYNVGGGAGSIAITANGPNCSWTASSLAPFASVQPGGGSGNGTVFVTVGSNAGSVNSRGGALLVNGQTVGILQAGTACTYALQSASGATPAAGGAGSVGVVAPSICTWGATTNTPAWLSITSAGTGGTGEVAFVAQPNLTTSQRIGTLTIAGPTGTPLTYTVTQAAASCNYTLPVTSITVAPMGDVAKEFSFTANAAGCAPAAVSYASWIKDVSTAIGGTAGTVSYSVESNPFSTQRTGTIQLGERTFTVTQIGGECGYSLAAYGALYSKAGGTGSVFGSPTASGCVPEVNVTQPFIIKATFGTPAPNVFQQDFGVQPYNVLTNSVRLGQIIFGGQVFTVKQSSW
jgi:hypothetical protein